MNDPIGDMLNQIKNAQAVGKAEVFLPFSKLKNEIANLLSKNNFVGEVKKIAKGKGKSMKINLKYGDGMPAIEGIKRISKPGQKMYFKTKEIKKIRGGFGISIISTSKGLMTNKEAKKAKLGGEVICEIW